MRTVADPLSAKLPSVIVPAVPGPRLIPSPYHPLHGFRLKLNRAQSYAETLNREIEAWLKRHPYTVFGEYEPGPPEQYLFKIRFLEPVPPEWGLLLGDFVHNAHSALDHLAYQVVMLGNGGIHQEQTAFPIIDAPCAWVEAADRRLKGASARHLGIIESFQPYHRRDYQGWYSIWGAIEDPLSILRRLSNVDKHIVLNATPAAMRALSLDVEVVRDIASIEGKEAAMGVLVDGDPVVTVWITSCGQDPELKLNPARVVEIWVQHRVDLGKETYTILEVPLKESVDEIVSRLWDIFKVFVPEFR
jgi:hypothetical protein